MRTSRNLVIVGLVVLVAVFLAAPSAFAKKKLADDELDLITAAGEPTVIEGVGGSVDFQDQYAPILGIEGTSQTALQGLVINNVSGENQLASALNIAAASFFAANTQSNSITQSWGATKDLSAVTVSATSAPGFAPTAVVSTSTSTSTSAAADATDYAAAQGQVNCGLAGEAKCALAKQGQIQINEAAAAHDSASASASATASASQPGISAVIDPSKIAVLSIYADLIITEVTGDVHVNRDQTAALAMDGNSQENIAALVLNNVVGLNQVANALNIMGSAISLGPAGLALGASTQDFQSLSQSNTIVQYRGTPVDRPVQFFK